MTPLHLALILVLAADPWHFAGWSGRAVVEIARPSDTPGCDVCGVKVLCQGRSRADGADFRVTDAAGKAVPFQLVFYDAARYALVSFKADNPKGKYFVYFDNPKSARAVEQVVLDEKPGAGPPKGAWVPRYGFTLQAIERPRGDNPRKVEELAKLMADSKARYGARYQRQVSEGYNLFGPSDYYISVYRGWVKVPKAGKYQFCTASNEASFSFLDGKELIHWPGRHTAERGARGEVNTLVDLTEGLHYLEYYHEEVTLEQMAFLGWRPSADEGPFGPIPASFFTMAHEGVVKGYETPKGPLVTFEPIITDSIWPAERSEGQYTRATFQAPHGFPPGTTWQWDFGDGQKAAGEKVDHVYLTLGTVIVKLTATSGKDVRIAEYPLRVFEIEHVTDSFKEGRPKDYVAKVKGYDRATLSAEALKELAYLYVEAEQPADALAAGRDFIKRFGDKEDKLRVARVRRLIADCAIRLGEGGLDEAIKSYRAALIKEMPTTEKLDVTGRLIRVVGVERGEVKSAIALLDDAEKLVKAEGVDDDGQAAFRRAVIAAGDVLLWKGKADEAQKHYARAERLYPRTIAPQVRIARIGAYPNSLREYVAAGNYGAALDLVDQWEGTFPTDKLNGQSIFWRGKVLHLRGQPRDALRNLDRAVRLATGSGIETEARWLLALTLEQLGKVDEAKRELAKLIATGIRDDFTKKAADKLKK